MLLSFMCPHCQALLVELTCRECGRQYQFKNSKYYLHRDDVSWRDCIEQVEAVRRAEATDQRYVENINRVFPEEPNRAVQQNDLMFEEVCKVIGDLSGKIFLEIGGSSGWASQRFIERGALCGYNIDIDEALLPLSTDKVISIVGDGYYPPFEGGVFDFVFDCASLHHFAYKKLFLKGVERMLKWNGVYVSQGNPFRQIYYDEDRDRYWKDYRLVETMPTQDEYKGAFDSALRGFNLINVDTNTVMWAKKIKRR